MNKNKEGKHKESKFDFRTRIFFFFSHAIKSQLSFIGRATNSELSFKCKNILYLAEIWPPLKRLYRFTSLKSTALLLEDSLFIRRVHFKPPLWLEGVGVVGGGLTHPFQPEKYHLYKRKKPSSWKQVCLGCKLYLAWYVQPHIIWIWCVSLNCEQWKYSQNQRTRVYDLLMLSGASLSYMSNTSTLFCCSINKIFIQHPAIHPFFHHRLQCRVTVPGPIPVVLGWKWGHTRDKAPVYCWAGTDR